MIPAAAPSIVGQWRETQSKDTTEFGRDGILRERLANGGLIEGRYALAGDRLQIQLNDVEEPLLFSFSVTAEALHLTDVEGQVTRYRRVS